jgi:hypothetical protein
MNKVFNVSCRKVGGITFIKVGRFNVSFSVSRAFTPIRSRPIGAKPLTCEYCDDRDTSYYGPCVHCGLGVQPSAMCSGPFWDELEAMASELRALDCGEASRDR